MKKLLFFSVLFITCFIINGCSNREYNGDEEATSSILNYGGWHTRAANIRLKMIMNHLGIKEEDFIIHNCGYLTEYNDVVHKTNQTCNLCGKKIEKKDVKYHDIR